MDDALWYPSVEDVLDIHDDIVSEYDETSSGVQSRGDVEYALQSVRGGAFGTEPETIHEKAFHLLRLLVANHPFVDGNKRTALDVTAVFYFLNGYRLNYDHEIRGILKRFGTDERSVDETEVVEYLRERTDEIDLNRAIDRWRDDLIEFGVERIAEGSADPND